MPRTILSALLLAAAAFAQGEPQTSAGKPLFALQSGFWVNLHHFLYVLGRARDGAPDSQRAAVIKAPTDLDGFGALDERERKTWNDAVLFYQKGPSKQDLIFDADLAAITAAVAASGNASDLSGARVPTTLRDTLERAAAIYRKVWWIRHQRANQARIAQLQDLLARYGKTVSAKLTAAYGEKWPNAGLVVQVSAYSNWAGAYSVVAGPIVISSTDERTSGSLALETIFHEAMHQWDDDMIPRLNSAAAVSHVAIPRQLSHALIFYTAGYVVSQVIPGHHPYAEGMWAPKGPLPGRPQLDAYWLPYLRGDGTLDHAIESLVTGFR